MEINAGSLRSQSNLGSTPIQTSQLDFSLNAFSNQLIVSSYPSFRCIRQLSSKQKHTSLLTFRTTVLEFPLPSLNLPTTHMHGQASQVKLYSRLKALQLPASQ